MASLIAGDGSFSSKSTLQILAFEAAKTMSRLVALYNSLSDDEFFKLRQGPVKSRGVAFLNSVNESYLLEIACKEKLEDLGLAVAVVSRLSKKCIDEGLNRFEFTYQSMTRGVIDIGNIGFSSRNVGKTIKKMEKYANATSALCESLVALYELEASEKKMQKWKINKDYFNQEITFQTKKVAHFKQVSLWSQTFDTTVGLMARIVLVVYSRICTIFGPSVPSLPCFYIPKRKALNMKVYPEANYCFLVEKDKYMKQASKSGPITKASKAKPRSHQVNALAFQIPETRNKRLIQSAPANTVGAAGLAFRYANLIIMAESCFHTTTSISDEARENMFEMLPISLKYALRRKLKSQWSEESDGGQGLAQGWKEALEEIIGWLAPVAHDTLRWQQERDLEQQKLNAKPTVLLLQTLHFSDLEKTEAAIVEVLVGLSHIYRHENRRERHVDGCFWL
ncbi:putative EF-TU receptor [Hibiscus syriacus]|uniref:EF-TU receptor n=1 Tax=Hibiscus syriacus TaxID=106335 RepID=A0A6A2XQ15_HIBSY|nr:putative EF-TU receptor [Hibiscus syriacus]